MKAKIDLEAGCVRMTDKLNIIADEAKQALARAERCERTGARWMELSKGIGRVTHIVRDCTSLRHYWFGKFLEEGYSMEKCKADEPKGGKDVCHG